MAKENILLREENEQLRRRLLQAESQKNFADPYLKLLRESRERFTSHA
jgi:regulator of replication initiation timing